MRITKLNYQSFNNRNFIEEKKLSKSNNDSNDLVKPIFLPLSFYKANFLTFKGDNDSLKREVKELKQEVKQLREDFEFFKSQFNKSDIQRVDKDSIDKSSIAYNEIVLPLLEGNIISDKDRETLNKYKNNEKFLKILQAHPNINNFLREIKGEETMAFNILKGILSPFIIWEFVVAKPDMLLELNTIGTKYENTDIFKNLKKDMEKEYYGREERFGDGNLADLWLKKLNCNPENMNEDQKLDRIIKASGGEKKILKEYTINLARENPMQVKKMADLMDMFFDNYIKSYKIED